MEKEDSVAPKERVALMHKAAGSGAQEDHELPLKLLVLGDFTMREDARSVEERKPIKVAHENFDEVMKAEDLSLSLVVPDRLTGDSGAALGVNIPIRTMMDFGPDNVAAAVPALKRLLELRKALKSLHGVMNESVEFKRSIESSFQNEGLRKQLCRELGIEDEPHMP